MTISLEVVGYGVAALAYAVAAFVITAMRPLRDRAAILMAAVASCLWAGGVAVAALGVPLPTLTVPALDALHLFVWTACVLSWLAPASRRKWFLGASAAAGLLAILASSPGTWLPGVGSTTYLAFVLMALTGFLTVEQVYRNAQEETRRQLSPLYLAAGAAFGIDLVVYAHATLLGRPEPLFWVLRGIANAALAPLLIAGASRKSGSDRKLYVSRHVMFYTASLLGVGGYLVAMGVVAYVIHARGREWSYPLDLAFLAAGMGVLIAVLFSATIRRRFNAFLVKHFYRNKYDYREAWLRLTQSLSRTGDLQESAANGLEGLARIIGAQRGDLWLERDSHRYDLLVSLGGSQPAASHGREHPLVAFLSQTGWVIDSEEYAREPDRYKTAFGHSDDGVLPADSVVVPLDCQGYLQGFVILRKPSGLRSLNFEDHDILKTAGRQVAAVLAQALAQEKLTETRQFEALNRLSAFLMHDLKNIVAQQDLVLANAQRFRHRPEFIDDALMTIRSGTDRIKRVLEQLATASRTKRPQGRVDVSKALMEVRSRCADRQPIPEIDLHAQAAWVLMDHNELTNVLFHLVRNAQDATPAEGHIRIGLSTQVGELLITVADDGCGMDGAFIRDRLFRPFDSTKGAEGMGIGAYQARDVIRLAGGELDVASEVGIGTTFTVRLPVAA